MNKVFSRPYITMYNTNLIYLQKKHKKKISRREDIMNGKRLLDMLYTLMRIKQAKYMKNQS